MLAVRQTNKQTDTVITILRTDIGGGVVTTTTHIRGDLICNLQHHTSSESFSSQRAEVQLAQAICAEMTAGVTSRPSPVVFFHINLLVDLRALVGRNRSRSARRRRRQLVVTHA